MIIFCVYFFIIGFLIYKNYFFGLFKDEVLNRNFILTAFLIKVAGLLVFHLVHVKLYGSINYSDTYNYFHESKIINSVAHWNFTEFCKLMFGLQNDNPDTELFRNFLRFTTVWDNDEGEWLYNDNRIMLRFHALIHFISGNNYYVHALISLFLGFAGIHWIYKSVKDLFVGKEIFLYAVWLIFPGLWFWSSGLLKEGPVLFIMGMLLVSCKRFSSGNRSIKQLFMLFISIILCFVFKQYVLMPIVLFTLMYYFVKGKFDYFNRKSLIFVALSVLFFFFSGILLKMFIGKSPVNILYERQRTFLDMSEGGIFLLDSTKFIRLPYDTSLITVKETRNQIDKYVVMHSGAKYAYCEHSHQQDTLYCNDNRDTVSLYQMYYVVPKARSTIKIKPMDNSFIGFLSFIPKALYITSSKPSMNEIRNTMDLFTVIENGLILLFFLVLLFNVTKRRKMSLEQVYWLSILIFVLTIIGITSPNIGAIERYRAPIIPFLFMAALFGTAITDFSKLSGIFKKQIK